MKVRSGFVSNSSSSSFILAVKEGHEAKELLEGASPLIKLFAGPAISFLSDLSLSPLAEAMKGRYEDWDAYDEEFLTLWREHGLELIEGENEDEWEFHYGRASTESDGWDGIGELTISYSEGEFDEGPVRLWIGGF